MLYTETGLQFTYPFTTVPVIKELTCFSQKDSGRLACICPNSHMIDMAINSSESYNPASTYKNSIKLYKHKIKIN